MFPDKIFVTGIGTGIGKSHTCSCLCRDYGYDYWKPVQSGDLDHSDSQLIERLSPLTVIYPERYKLTQPISPHASAEIDGISITLESFVLPPAEKLCVEGAGGLLVPLNDEHTMADLIKHFSLPVILVIRDYLGCINHTMLTVEVLKAKELQLAGVVYNGDFSPSTLEYLEHKLTLFPSLYLPELKDNGDN